MNYYFLGIGGIGMSALARYFKQCGHIVSGYDRTESPLTKQLESLNICHFYVAWRQFDEVYSFLCCYLLQGFMRLFAIY